MLSNVANVSLPIRKSLCLTNTEIFKLETKQFDSPGLPNIDFPKETQLFVIDTKTHFFRFVFF